jgi:hypothetical protein
MLSYQLPDWLSQDLDELGILLPQKYDQENKKSIISNFW